MPRTQQDDVLTADRRSARREPGAGVPRVLWLSEETPDRHGQGGQRRQYFQIRELVRSGCAVHVVSLAGPQDDTSVRSLAKVSRVRTWLRGVRNPVAHARIGLAVRSRPAPRVVLAHEESWDLLRFAPGIDAERTMVDLHNVMSSWNRSLGDEERADHYLGLETQILERVGRVAVCSPEEMTRLPAGGPARRVLLPHGFDPDEWAAQPGPCDALVVASFGSWGWEPNARGLAWFLREVWPAVRSRVPGATFALAGSGVAASVAAVPGVVLHGRVPSLADFTANARALVVPVVDGVGAPVKLAECLASGRPVVATTDGGSAHPGSPATVTDDPRRWVATLVDLLNRPEHAHRLGVRTRAWAEENATWSAVSRSLVSWAHGEPG